MDISKNVTGVKHRFKVVYSKDSKNKFYHNENELQDADQAEAAFIESRQKLLNVNV